jgi:hypothetical protein
MFKVGDLVTRKPEHRQDGLWLSVAVDNPDTVAVVTAIDHEGYLKVLGKWFSPYLMDLEAPPTARSNDPATSKGERKVNKYEQAVLDTLSIYGDLTKHGWTGKEIAHQSGHPLNCITPRFAPLRRKGLIKPWQVLVNGEYTTIKRDKQIVWVLA